MSAAIAPDAGNGHLAVAASAKWPEPDERPIQVVLWSSPSASVPRPPAGEERWIVLLIE